jgi:cellulose synthase (UDP-forming)
VLDLSEGGLALRAESNLGYNSDQVGSVTIRSGGEDFRFAVRPIRTSDNRIHLRFLGDNLKHQRDITKLIYARADSWLDWNKDQKRDRILSSFIHVLGIGATGIWTIPGYLIRRQKKTEIVKAKKLSRALPVLLAALLLGGAISLRAQTVPAVLSSAQESPTNTADLTFSDHQSFSDLNAKSAFVLTGQHTRNTLNFVLPGTKVVSDADLTLYAHGGEITLDQPLEMAIALNGVEIGTVAVKDSILNQPVKISLPSDLLVHENSLSFEIRRVTSTGAAAPIDKGWLRIEPISDLHTSGLLLALPNRLSMLPEPFFDRSLQGSLELPVVLDPRPDTQTLRAAGIVASWFGSLSAHRGAHYTSSLGHLPKGNVVLLAHSNSALALSLGLTDSIVIAIRENPSDKYGKVLALIAPDGPELAKLALLLGTDRLATDTDKLVLSEEELSSFAPAAAQTIRWEDATHPIHLTANLAASLLSVRLNSPSQLYFRLAPDLDYGSRITVPLELSYKLTGLRDGDHIWASLFLNNTFVTKRRLSLDDAGNNRRQSFAIPVSLLFSSNTLRLELFTDKQETTVSDPNSVEFQVLPQSTLDLQNPTHFVQMPRLDLFAASGFPFTQRADLADTTVVLPEYLTTAQIGLYLDAISFLSAQSETVASKFTVIHARELLAGTPDNILVISSANDDGTFLPLQRSMVIVPAGGTFSIGNTQLAWREWISRAWLGRREELQRLDSLLDRESSLRFMLEGFRSPYHPNRSVVVVATRSETDDNPYFEALLKASREGAVSGGLTLADSDHFFSFSLNPSAYFLGDSKSRAAVFGWLRFHLWILPLLLLGLSALVARWWEDVLARQAEYRFQLMS